MQCAPYVLFRFLGTYLAKKKLFDVVFHFGDAVVEQLVVGGSLGVEYGGVLG